MTWIPKRGVAIDRHFALRSSRRWRQNKRRSTRQRLKKPFFLSERRKIRFLRKYGRERATGKRDAYEIYQWNARGADDAVYDARRLSAVRYV